MNIIEFPQTIGAIESALRLIDPKIGEAGLRIGVQVILASQQVILKALYEIVMVGRGNASLVPGHPDGPKD